MTLYMQVATLVVASTTAVAVLAATWAGRSGRHWFWRTLTVLLAVMAMLPIRAYEPAMVLGISLPPIAWATWFFASPAMRQRSKDDLTEHSTSLFRFTLAD